MNTKLPLFLLLAYLVQFTLLGIAPYDRSVWWAENLPILLIVLTLVLSYRYHAFSNTLFFRNLMHRAWCFTCSRYRSLLR